MAYAHCLERIRQAVGQQITDAEIGAIFERIHKASQDIRAGKTPNAKGDQFDGVVQQAAREAAAQFVREAELKQRQAHLQIVRLSGLSNTYRTMVDSGISPLKAVEYLIARNYTGKTNVASLEQVVAGHKAYFQSKMLAAWDALGNDYLGFFQDRAKLLDLVRELRGEDTGNTLAKQGAEAFHKTAEEARQVFNRFGGDIGKLDDWGMPQHHSQQRVAGAGRDAWVNDVLPRLDRARYVDDLGRAWDDARLREFLGKAWDTIATNGHANAEPGKFTGSGKVANRHAESRQIHFKDADSVISYWEQFGDKSAFEILSGHVETLAKDIGFIEQFGPNPDVTYRTLRDTALKEAVLSDPTKATTLEGKAVSLDILYNYSSGKTKPSVNQKFSNTADAVANLNSAGKLGGAALASLFGDKPIMEAVSHLNNLPILQRWRTELSLLNPANKSDRRLLQQQGLMLEGVRNGLQRFGDNLGKTGVTGKLSNAVMRVTGMNAINEIRKGAFGASLMSAIGDQIAAGKGFDDLHSTDIRALNHLGVTKADWDVWRQAKLQDIGSGNTHALTPESISSIPGIDAEVKRQAIVKLLGMVNTESDFAIVTPGWKERSTFYGDLQRGTVKGEVVRSILQFKSFPWTAFHRMADAVGNSDGKLGKAGMTAYLVGATTLAGLMLIQSREMLAGKDPRDMTDPKLLGAAFLQGGALGIYGDFIYGAGHTRYGSGILESLSGPTIGPLLELTLVQPIDAIAKANEGKDSHFLARQLQDLKGFVPGGNIWYTKAALDHLIFQNVFESLSPGYLDSIRSRTQKEYNQDWWWNPGDLAPERAPNLNAAIGE